MAIGILVVEVRVKLFADFDIALVVLLEDNGKGVLVDLGILALLGALLGETLGADDLGVGVFLGPFGDEDVVLEIEGDDVAYVAAEFGDFGFGFIGQSDGGEDGESAGCEFD